MSSVLPLIVTITICLLVGYVIGYMVFNNHHKTKKPSINELMLAQLKGEERAFLTAISLIANMNEYKASSAATVLEKLAQRLSTVQRSIESPSTRS